MQVATSYLHHLRQDWNDRMARHEPAYRLENQQVIITVPASFDEVAQQLTHIELQHLSFIGPDEFVNAFARDFNATSSSKSAIMASSFSLPTTPCTAGSAVVNTA